MVHVWVGTWGSPKLLEPLIFATGTEQIEKHESKWHQPGGRWMTGHRGGWMVDWRSGSSIVSPFILPPPPPINHCTASCCLCSKGFGRIPPDHFSACPHETHCLSSPPPINFTARFLSFAAETHSHSRAIHTGASQTYFQYLNRKNCSNCFCRKHI